MLLWVVCVHECMSGGNILGKKERGPPIYPCESENCPVMSDSLRPPWIVWNSPGQNTGVGSHSLLQGIFPTQGPYLP